MRHLIWNYQAYSILLTETRPHSLAPVTNHPGRIHQHHAHTQMSFRKFSRNSLFFLSLLFKVYSCNSRRIRQRGPRARSPVVLCARVSTCSTGICEAVGMGCLNQGEGVSARKMVGRSWDPAQDFPCIESGYHSLGKKRMVTWISLDYGFVDGF